MQDQFEDALVTEDPRTTAAVNYAADKVKEMLTCDNHKGLAWYDEADPNGPNGGPPGHTDRDEETEYSRSDIKGCVDPIGTVVPSENGREYEEYQTMTNTDHIGFVLTAGDKGSDDDGNDHSTAAINLNNLAKTYLTFFANYMKGLDKPTYDVHKGPKYESRFVTDDADFGYKINQTVVLRTEETKDVTFYDTLLNQIATCGWTENDEITDNSYLQEMIQNGMMYISTVSDDNYYYQRNYNTWNYVREVTDDTAVAQAEARYKTEKEKLNSKEQRLDLKMKNLDTEISALTTEYDTVKNLISKSIEKSFKRYNA